MESTGYYASELIKASSMNIAVKKFYWSAWTVSGDETTKKRDQYTPKHDVLTTVARGSGF